MYNYHVHAHNIYLHNKVCAAVELNDVKTAISLSNSKFVADRVELVACLLSLDNVHIIENLFTNIRHRDVLNYFRNYLKRTNYFSSNWTKKIKELYLKCN